MIHSRRHHLSPTSYRRPRATLTSRAVAAGQAGDDHIEDGDDTIDDGAQNGTDGVDDAHQAGANGVEDALDLMNSQYWIPKRDQ